MTNMYNVLETLRAEQPLSEKEKVIHEQGLVSVLRHIHDELDAAVFDSYGWPTTLTDEEILERLVALNAERAKEERNGLIRWLRPEFQNPAGAAQQTALETEADGASAPAAAKAKQEKLPWPTTLAEQARAVRTALATNGGVTTPVQLAKQFTNAKTARIEELLQTLVSLGQARELEDGKFVA